MNIDEIKKAMEHEESDLQIPFSVSEIKTSKTSIKKVKWWITADISVVIAVTFILIYHIFFGEMYRAAQVIYNYTAFIAIMASLGAMAFQIRIFRNLSIENLTSKKTIQNYIIVIRTYIEFAKFIFSGLGASVLIPIVIASFGTEHYSEKFVTDIMYLNNSTQQIYRTIAYIVLISVTGYFASVWVYKYTLEKESKKLEKILDQF